MRRRLDTASTVTLATTLVLFVLALFIKGFGHDLLLEAGVFLVSVKLVLADYKHAYITGDFIRRLDQIDAKLTLIQQRGPEPGTPGRS